MIHHQTPPTFFLNFSCTIQKQSLLLCKKKKQATPKKEKNIESKARNMQQRNDGSNKKRTLVANKIGAILSSACGIARSRNIALGFGVAAAADDEEAKEKELPLNKTNRCHQIQVHAPTKCITLPCRQRPIEVASAVLTRKWKTSLKRVKLSLKRDDVKARKKTTTKGNDELELELCKKRILMGEKCRALNLSGVLHYDNQGILLPED